ncbi:MAG: DUF2793 domain-containing protein [Phreatobacter sp.]|nr:DUF2793 domain-containing protein [Phreatobacter sp.]
MSTTTHLGLPLIAAAQAQKHVTHNEALQVLDALVQLAVADSDRTAPPGAPAEGDRHIVAAGGTGDWSGHDGEVAAFLAGGWVFVAARRGFVALDAAENRLLIHDGAEWRDLSTALRLQNLGHLGVNATADDTNRFAVRSGAALFSHVPAAEGGSGDMRLTLNRETAGDTASLVFQSGWSGRAELGLAGDDTFRLKVSADGAAWTEAMTVDPASGRLSLPAAGLRAGAAELAALGSLWGINTAAPSGTLRIVHDGTGQVPLVLERCQDSGSPNIVTRRSRGSVAARTAVQAGDVVGGQNAFAHDGTDYRVCAQMRPVVDGAVSTGIVPSRWEIFTTDTSGVTAVRTTVDRNGDLIQTGAIRAGGPVRPGSFTVATLPAAADHAGALVDVVDEAGGRTLAMSDGADWRRVHDRAVVS